MASNDGVKRSRMGALFGIKMLAWWEFLNSLMTVFKDRRPEIASAKDFLSCSHPSQMTTTCSKVAIIKHMFILLMGEAFLENRINPMSIQGIIQDEVVFRVVTDTVVFVTG